MVDEGLIALLRDEQLDMDAALARRGDREQQRLVRNEVGADDDDLALGGVEQSGEQLEVVLELEARALTG